MNPEKNDMRDTFKRRLYVFTLKLIQFIEKLPKDNVSRRIGDQLIRSGTSIIANYVEGQAGSSKKDFTNFLNHSLKSANETKLWVALLRDSGKADREKSEWFLKELDEYSKILGKSLVTLRKKK
jgi:four helix bundle protein